MVIADIDGDAAARTATELGARASAATLDVADAAAVTALVRQVVADHGRLDVMVNNAGVAIGGLLEELDERHWTKALDVNLRGVINGVTAAYEVMRAQGSGHILNTASLAGLIPAPRCCRTRRPSTRWSGSRPRCAPRRRARACG